jgi:GntR family transcriptional repressor for pyruvate dehydrogenase complex
MTSLQPIKRTKVYEAAMSQLLALIEDGTYSKGDRLPTERELTEVLGISRASVRQALAGLAALGLIESRPGDGSYVTSGFDERWQVDVASALETLEGRRAIETETARLAALRRTEEDVKVLRSVLDVMEEEVAEGVHPIDTDREFHRAVARSAHSEFLEQAMEVLAEQMSGPEWHRMKIWGLRGPEQTARIMRQHRAILEAIADQDPQNAQAIMREHIDTIIEDVHAAEQAKTSNSGAGSETGATVS